MQKYRKKPVEIDAIEWTGANVDDVLAFIATDDRWKAGIDDGYVGGPGIGHTPPLGTLDIPTLEGTMTASAGDWIIRGVAGELYPCKPAIFATSYDAVQATDADDLDHEAPVGACSLRAVADADWTPHDRPSRLEFTTQQSDGLIKTLATARPAGWAYWLDDHWHLTAEEPTAHERREQVYVIEIAEP